MRPTAWPIASFLPLPLDPALADARSQTDLEQQFARNLGAIDDKAFQKAHWWRNVNRVMTGVGTLLVGVIVSSQYASQRIIVLMKYRSPLPYLRPEWRRIGSLRCHLPPISSTNLHHLRQLSRRGIHQADFIDCSRLDI